MPSAAAKTKRKIIRVKKRFFRTDVFTDEETGFLEVKGKTGKGKAISPRRNVLQRAGHRHKSEDRAFHPAGL